MSISAFSSLNKIDYKGDLQISGGQLGFTVFASAASFDQTNDFLTINDLYYLDPTASGTFDLVKIENTFGTQTCVPGYSFWISNESTTNSLDLREISTNSILVNLAPQASCYVMAKTAGSSGLTADEWVILNNFPLTPSGHLLEPTLVDSFNFVDAQFGDDATAQIENPARPYQTIGAAITAALANPGKDFTIQVRPGTYTLTNNSDDMYYYLEPGVTIQSGSSLPIFNSCSIQIYGYGSLLDQSAGTTDVLNAITGYIQCQVIRGHITGTFDTLDLVIRENSPDLTIDSSSLSSVICPFSRMDGSFIRSRVLIAPILGNITLRNGILVSSMVSEGTRIEVDTSTASMTSSVIINPDIMEGPITTNYISDDSGSLTANFLGLVSASSRFLANRVDIVQGSSAVFNKGSSIGLINAGSTFNNLLAEKIIGNLELVNGTQRSTYLAGEVTGTVSDNPVDDTASGIFGRINTSGGATGLSLVSFAGTSDSVNVFVLEVHNIDILNDNTTVNAQQVTGSVANNSGTLLIGNFQGTSINTSLNLRVEIFQSQAATTSEFNINSTNRTDTYIGRYELRGTGVTELTVSSSLQSFLVIGEIIQVSATHTHRILSSGNLSLQAQQLEESAITYETVANGDQAYFDIKQARSLTENFLNIPSSMSLRGVVHLDLGQIITNGIDINPSAEITLRLTVNNLQFVDANIFRLHSTGDISATFNCQTCSMVTTTLAQLLDLGGTSSGVELLLQGRYYMESSIGGTVNGIVYTGTIDNTGCKRSTIFLNASAVGSALTNNSGAAITFVNEDPLVTNAPLGGSSAINLLFPSPDDRDQVNVALANF